MSLETAPDPPRKSAVQAAEQGLLGFAAGEGILQVFGEPAAGAEDGCFERALAQTHDLGDLGIRAALELTHDECRALSRRQMLERPEDVGEAGIASFVGGLRDLLVERDLTRLALPAPKVPTNLVVRDP